MNIEKNEQKSDESTKGALVRKIQISALLSIIFYSNDEIKKKNEQIITLMIRPKLLRKLKMQFYKLDLNLAKHHST